MIWTKVVVLHGSPKANGWSRFSLSSAHHHLMGIPIFSSAIFRWSSDTSWIINFMNHRKISLLLNIHQQKTWSIPTLTHSTRRFCCFRKKKKTSFALSCDRPLCLEPRLQHNGSPLGIIGGISRNPDPMGPSVAPNMRLFSISKHHWIIYI